MYRAVGASHTKTLPYTSYHLKPYLFCLQILSVNLSTQHLILQDAQLSQRDRAAGCVIVFAKIRTLELGDNDLRTL